MDSLNIDTSIFAGSTFIISSFFVVTLIVKEIRSAFGGIPTVLGWQSPSAKRAMLSEEITSITEQLKDSALPAENRGMLEQRREEIQLLRHRDIDAPAFKGREIIKVSTDMQVDGLKWALLREVQDRIDWKDGRLQVHVSGWELLISGGKAVLAGVLWLYAYIAFYALTALPAGTLLPNVINTTIILTIIASLGGYWLLRSVAKTYLARAASQKLDTLHQRLQPKPQRVVTPVAPPSAIDELLPQD